MNLIVAAGTAFITTTNPHRQLNHFPKYSTTVYSVKPFALFGCINFSLPAQCVSVWITHLRHHLCTGMFQFCQKYVTVSEFLEEESDKYSIKIMDLKLFYQYSWTWKKLCCHAEKQSERQLMMKFTESPMVSFLKWSAFRNVIYCCNSHTYLSDSVWERECLMQQQFNIHNFST